jgi:hypothetical protein
MQKKKNSFLNNQITVIILEHRALLIPKRNALFLTAILYTAETVFSAYYDISVNSIFACRRL